MDDGGYYGGGRRGGFGRGGGRGGFQNQNKRKREDYEEDDRRQLLASLMELGDTKQGEQQASVEERVEDMAVGLRRQLRHDRGRLCQYIVDCAVELGTKTPTYAMLVGLVNGDDHDLVAELVGGLTSDYEAALSAGQRHRARMLLRLMAALVVVNVVQPSDVLTVLEAVVSSAIAIADAGDKSDEGRQWQPYTDYLVYSALMALPWGGPELVAGAADGDDRLGPLFEDVEKYMGLRLRQRQPGLAPFSAPLDDEDVAARSDSGGASFLGDVWMALQEWRDSRAWRPVSVPALDLQHYEATLAVGGPVELRPPMLPGSPPLVPDNASPAEVAAEVAAAFPARGIIKLLPAARTGGDRPPLDRLIAEDYILDTIFFFDGSRVDCAGRLAYALPLPYDYDALLAELLFSQMLALPRPQYKPIAYSCLIVDLCKAVKAFPKSMSGCVRELFARMEVMDTELRGRCTEWLAFQLSNFDFVWPWHKWLHVLKAPPHSAQRRFVGAVLDRMVRLSYYDNVIQKTDKGIAPLLPPKPDAAPLPDGAADGIAENGDAATDAQIAERQRAAEMVALMKSHIRQLKPTGLNWEAKANEGVTEWIEEQNLRAELGGVVGVIRAVATGLLVAGAKSFTHMITFVERYGAVLDGLLREAGTQGEEALVDVATGVWASSPQRAAMAVDRLMALRLVSAAAIARWVFSSPGVAAPDDHVGGEVAWDILYAAVDKTAARTQDEADDVAAYSAVLAEKEAAAQSAADYAARKQREVDDARAAGLPAGVSISDMENAAQRAASEAAGAQDLVARDQQEMERRRLAHRAAQQEQQDLLMQVFSAFKEALSGAAAMDTEAVAEDGGEHEQQNGDAGAATESRAAWRRLLLGNLRTFARRYFRDAAPLAQRLEDDVFAEGAVDENARRALLLSFHF